jgi:hypothetical protein
MGSNCKKIELFLKGDKKVIVKILILVIIVIVLFPMISDYFYGNVKLKQQIDILKELNELSKEIISEPQLNDYYQSILKNFGATKPANAPYITTTNAPRNVSDFFTSVNILKFIAGSIWWIILLVIVIFMKEAKISTKITGIILVLILVLTFGVVGIYIPTFNPLIINIIGFPILQITLLIVIIVIINKTNTKKNVQSESS